MLILVYMSIIGECQGLIIVGNFIELSVGNIYQEGYEDQCLVEVFKYNIILLCDFQSGQFIG